MRLTLPRQRGGRFRVGGKERFQPQFRDVTSTAVAKLVIVVIRRSSPRRTELERYREAQVAGWPGERGT